MLTRRVIRWLMLTSVAGGNWGVAQAGAAPGKGAPALTIYNDNFGVVREMIDLQLQAGVNSVSFSDTTAQVEPASVILRDPTGKRALRILEQNYRNDPLSQELLLSKFEGQTIEFQLDPNRVISGKIIRSGYVAHPDAWNRYGYEYYQTQAARASAGGGGVPIIEIDGKLRFGLPGVPLLPNLGMDTILKPALEWKLEASSAGPLEAELAYVTGGMSWAADYNVLSSEKSDALDLLGWVTMDNQCGRSFENARIKLMAGEVKKIRDQSAYMGMMAGRATAAMESADGPPVSEKAFDEYHLYTLQNATTLRDRDTKQVEFIRAAGIASRRVYVYDGLLIDARYQNWDEDSIRQNADYGAHGQTKVWVMREFANSQANHLGLPLPAGRLRFYRQDDDGRLEFVGENQIPHTPRDETLRVYTGNAFDLVGQRKRTNFQIDNGRRVAEESFEIKVRNHKRETVTVRVIEHLYRWATWELIEKSASFEKRAAQLIEFSPSIEPDQEASITYKVRYTW